MKHRKLGEILRDRKQCTDRELILSVEEQQRTGGRLGEVLLASGTVSKDELVGAMQEVLRASYQDCAEVTPDEDALACIPDSLAIKHCVIPMRISGKFLQVVMAEPQDVAALDELQFASGLQIQPFFGFRAEIFQAITRSYGDSADSAASLDPAGLAEVDIEFTCASSSQASRAAVEEFQAELRGQKTEATLVVSEMLIAAISKKASDIHIEQHAQDALVRVRIDGVLRELRHISDSMRSNVVSRIKILSDLNITERRVSQDGRFLVRLGGRRFDIRVSTLPTQYGEKVVMRVLDPRSACVPFEQLGFSKHTADVFKRLVRLPQGMVLVTGPTGSGKSTTLCSVVNMIQSSTVNITTIEDPIEYVLEGINQVQVHPKSGRTFAGCLRAMLRQDPNVVMVGEIRDAETAEIALTAAQTGRLLLSTMHTNDSLSAVTRLADLGIPPFLIASSLSAVLAQRLVRRLCRYCCSPNLVSAEAAAALRALGAAKTPHVLYQPKGCNECDGTGYDGRIGIYELLVVDDSIADAIRHGATEEILRDLALAAGTTSMMGDALAKIVEGVTTLDEVIRVIPQPKLRNLTCGVCHQILSPAFNFCPSCGASKDNSKLVLGQPFLAELFSSLSPNGKLPS